MKPIFSSVDSPARVITALQEQIHHLEGIRRPRSDRSVSSGCPPLDWLLPEGGFPRGALIEWLSGSEGSGAATLAMMSAREAVLEGGVFVVMDRQQRFYPPAAAALGIDLDKTVLIRAACARDELWALDQALRCPGVAAVYASLDVLDWRWFRRLQLAVETGGGLGLFVRSAKRRGQPSWSQIQLFVQPRPSAGPRRLCVEVTRCFGMAPGRVVELVIEDRTGVVHAADNQETRPASARWKSNGRSHITSTGVAKDLPVAAGA